MTPEQNASVCPWCQDARPLASLDESCNYVICSHHQQAMLAQYTADRQLLRIGRSERRIATSRPRRLTRAA